MTTPEPWYAEHKSADGDPRQHAPATLRNRDAILAVLRRELPTKGELLEVAGGSGEHALFLAQALPGIDWQPSDCSDAALASISAWRKQGGPPANLAPPMRLDLMRPEDWPASRYSAMFAANLTHIAPFAATEGLFALAGRVLAERGKLLLYGPFFRDDAPPSEGDLHFDASLRTRDTGLGIRHVADIDGAAKKCGLDRAGTHAMPANNVTLVYRRS